MQKKNTHIPRQRNAAIDAMRLIMALFVMAIHTGWTHFAIIEQVIRMAVPFFLFISGMYLYSDTHQELQRKTKRALYKLLKIVIGPVLTLVLLFAAYDTFVEHNLQGVIEGFTNFSSWKALLLHCKPMYCMWHLWYLVAYLYVLVALYICSKMRIKISVLIGVAVAMLIIRYFLNYKQQSFYLYDFLFEAIPCMIAGMACSHFCDKLHKVSTKFWASLLIVSLAVGLISSIFILRLTAVFALVEILRRYQSQGRKKDRAISKLGLMGCDLALYIYIFHVLWLRIFERTEYFTTHWIEEGTTLTDAAVKFKLWFLVSACTIASILAVRYLIRRLRKSNSVVA